MSMDRLNNMTSRIAARLLGRNAPPAPLTAQSPAQLPADVPAEAVAEARQARLQALQAVDGRDPEQELEMLSLTLRLEPDTDLRPALLAFNAAHPANAGGLYLAGVAHLKQDDASGLALLERAMELDHEAVPAACEHAHNFLAARGETALAERYALRARLHAALDGAEDS